MTKEQERLQEFTNDTIAELVYPKLELLKAYNYYAGIMDPELYRYLEENYGIGLPTQVEFIPLVKKHIDAIVGEYLETPILPKVSCKDKETISNIDREKLIHITNNVFSFLQKKLKNLILSFIDGKDITDKAIEEQLNTLIEDLNLNFVSEYEIAAQNVIDYIMQSRLTDIITKLRLLLTDVLITGYCFYKVGSSSNKNNVKIEILDPLNTFIDRNPESPYVKDSYRVVCRKWMSKSQILNKYGRDLSKEDLDTIKEEWDRSGIEESSYYVRNLEHHGIPATNGILAGREVVIPGYPSNERYSKFSRLIPVYEVEWIETDKNFVMNRYSTIRIGDDIYILNGKDENVIRSKDNPDICTLTINGVFFLNRSAQPYSLMLACASLLEKYNILHYFRDNLIANSGTIGDYIDMSLLPSWLGTDPTERLRKYIAYKKTGIAPIDTSQEGRLASGQAPLNTIFNGYDDTVKALAILAILLAIDSIEQTCSSITGVFRERLNGILAHDAVTNIKIGLTNSFTVTKLYNLQMDLVTCEIILDALNEAKIVYKNGLTGSLILGEKYLKIFTALPEHFTLSDYDIHITTSSEVIKDMELIKLIIPEFIKSLSLAPDIIFEALTCKSLSDLKHKVRTAMKKQKLENNLLLLLLLQSELLQQQLQEAQKQLLDALKLISQLDQLKMQIEQLKLQMLNKIEWYRAQTERTYRLRDMDNDEKRVEVEILQLHDGNPYNDKIKD